MTAPADRLRDDEAAVLLLHGVVDGCDHPVRNYTGKHMDRGAFADTIAPLAAAGTPRSLADILDHLDRGEAFPPRSFAITFDDGFENNLTVAAPILADAGVPATIFVTSGFVEHNRMSWIDRIEHAIETAAAGRLTLPWAADPRPFDGTASRIALLDEVRVEVKSNATLDVDALVADVFDQTGVTPVDGGDDPIDRKLTWSQVAELADDDLFDVGGHGHRHRIMSFLDDGALADEVGTCLDLLRTRAAVETRLYSYPEGLAHCCCDRSIRVLRTHGIRGCPTAVDGTVPVTADPFRMRRIAL